MSEKVSVSAGLRSYVDLAAGDLWAGCERSQASCWRKTRRFCFLSETVWWSWVNHRCQLGPTTTKCPICEPGTTLCGWLWNHDLVKCQLRKLRIVRIMIFLCPELPKTCEVFSLLSLVNFSPIILFLDLKMAVESCCWRLPLKVNHQTSA